MPEIFKLIAKRKENNEQIKNNSFLRANQFNDTDVGGCSIYRNKTN